MRKQCYLRIAETDNGEIAVKLDLAGSLNGDTVSVPFCDMLALALTRLLSQADPAIHATLPIIQEAYAAMAEEEDPVKATTNFNNVIGIEVYSVSAQQEDPS